MATGVTPDDAGPSAFEVKLSISTGRHSPDVDAETVKVNAGSTVRMVFMNGAYVLRDVHGRDAETLQKDFDLYLVRPNKDDIVLNPSREIADYGIKRNDPMDQLQFRHKTLPIPIVVNLCDGDDRKIEVNSGFPLMDIIPTICDRFGIKEHSELSLAKPSSEDSENTMQFDWLDLTSSLNGQGVKDGDTLLLRKKFFILNDDIAEALRENDDLKELIYKQVCVQYLTGRYVGGCHGDDADCALVSALLHHIEQGSENISDDQSTSRVMPCDRQKDASFYAQVVTTYYRDHIGSLERTEAKHKLLQLLTEKQTILVNYFPVKVSEDSAEHVVVIDSDCVALCVITELFKRNSQLANHLDVPSQPPQLQTEDINAALDNLSAVSGSTSSATPAAILPVSDNATEIEFNVPSPSIAPAPREERKRDLTRTIVHIPDFLELDFRQILDDYKLFHIVVMKQDIRPVLLHTGKPIEEVVKAICGTFSISDPSDYYLWIPTGIQSIIEKYGGKPKIRAGKYKKRHSSGGDFAPRLDNTKSLREQYDFNIKPYLLHLKMYQSDDDVDAPDESSLDCGDEWPDCEHPDVARYRRFYQSWTGLVQGAYPVDKKAAVKLAAMLTQVYYGDRERARVWPPQDYDPKSFMPEKFRSSFGVVNEIEKHHRELTGATTHECINDIIEACQKLITHQGVFFDISVPVKSDIMAVIPWRKMEHRWFGINQHGIFSVDKETGKILFTHRFSDIYKWTSTENSFQLNFKEWAEEFHGYTYQTREILNTLELFIQMTVRGRINQAPSKPSSLSSGMDSGSPVTTPPSTPVKSSLKSPLNDSAENDLPKRSSVSTPTSYDL